MLPQIVYSFEGLSAVVSIVHQLARRRVWSASVRRLPVFAGFFVALAFGVIPGQAIAVAQETAPAESAAPAEAPAIVVDGFRSAKFGMTEDEVRAAIEADFGLSGDAVVAGENSAERTQILTVVADELLTSGGKAQVSYVFGYTSKTLIQVGVSWNSQIDPSVDAAKLYANGDVLTAYFTGAGYVPASIRTGVVLDTGILLFRGEDAERHATILILQGAYSGGGDTQRVLTPTSLALLYTVDSENPDIFQIEPGKF